MRRLANPGVLRNWPRICRAPAKNKGHIHVKNSIKKAALRSATCLSFASLALSGSAQAQDADNGQAASPAPDAADQDNTIIVTGSRIRQPDNYTSPEPMTTLTDKTIKEQGYASIVDALQSNAITGGGTQINNYYGNYVVDGGTGVNTIGLRGLDAKRTLVLLNGHRLAPAGTGGSVGTVDLNTIPTTIVKSVEVLKAGASSIYGSDAIGGVVNIITDDDFIGPRLDASISIPESGAGVERRISGAWGLKGDNWKFHASVDWRKRDALTYGDTKFGKCPIDGTLDGQGGGLGSGDYIDPATGKPKCWTIYSGGVTINTVGLPGSPSRFRPTPGTSDGYYDNYTSVGLYSRDSFSPDMLKQQIINPVETLNVFTDGSYELNALGNAEIYGEFLYSHRKSSSNSYRQLTLDYAQGSPLLAADIRDGDYSGPTEISNGQEVAARSFIGYGLLDSTQLVNFYRANGGIRGDLGISDWRYDVYGSYSWMRSSYGVETFITSHLAQSLNAVANGDGTFSCADATGGCVAAPVLDAASVGGNLSRAYRDWITQNVVGHTKTAEYIGSINLDGSLFQLPGGVAKANVGFEYRHSHLNDQPGAASAAGDLYNYTAAAPTVGSDEVWEAYGEVFLPILANLPGVYRLNLDASGRYTHYRSYGGEWTYKASAEYSPIRGATLRASYGTSYRAPTVFEQYLGATTGFFDGTYDPCSSSYGAPTPTITANCAAVGLGNYTNNDGVLVESGGGRAQGVKAETSDNLSAGIVLNPALPAAAGNVSISLDYFSIKIKNGVAQLGASNILNLCYNAAAFNPDSGYCQLITRDPTTNAPTVVDNYLNVSTQKTRGLEFNINYSRDIGPGRFSFNADVTRYLEQATQTFATAAMIDANNTVGVPKWVGSFNASYKLYNVTLHWGMDWIGKTGDETYKYLAKDTQTGVIDPDAYEFYKTYFDYNTPNYFLHNASIAFDVADDFTLTLGVRNIFGSQPPKISSYGQYVQTTANAPLYSGYDYYGRTFFGNITTKF